MRISDWSSDVCSSDLLKLRKITGLVDSQHAKAPEVHTTLDALGISILDDKGLDTRRHDPKTEALNLGIPQNDRSEEHTSELQSLMRNSYAVFCLQKKYLKNKFKINTHQTHTHTDITNKAINIQHQHKNNKYQIL